MHSNTGKEKIVKARVQKEFSANISGKRLDKGTKKAEHAKRKARRERHNFEEGN